VEHTHDITCALQRLDAALPTGGPWLEATLRPPVVEGDLQALRDAIAPWPLPAELCAYLRWHDGQSDEHAVEWWPTLNAGVLTPTQFMITNYQRACSDDFMGPWPRGWLPLTQEGWNVTALELVQDRPPVLISISVDHRQLITPSLAAMLHTVADLAAERALISMAEGPAPKEATGADQEVLHRATSQRYEGAWQHWRAVEREHHTVIRQRRDADYLYDPDFHRSIGWS